jgi:hypothetical protein
MLKYDCQKLSAFKPKKRSLVLTFLDSLEGDCFFN